MAAQRHDLDCVIAAAKLRAVALERQLDGVAVDGDDLVAHAEKREPGESSGTPFLQSGQLASSHVSSESESSDSYGASNGFGLPLRLRIDAKPKTRPLQSSTVFVAS